MKRIVCLGAAMQNIYLVDHDDLASSKVGDTTLLTKVTAGSEINIDKLYFKNGGSGLVTAITLSRYGHQVVLMSNIARDAAGEAILSALDEESIDNSYLGIMKRGGTGVSTILLDSKSGEWTTLTYRGASVKYSNFDEKDLDLIQPDWLYVTTLNGDFETLERFFKKARENGVKIMFNPGARELAMKRKLLKLLSYVDVLLMNKEEAAKLVPGVLLTELVYHLGSYVPVAIITDGSMGGIIGDIERGEIYRFGIYEDVKARDATGAGDAFGAGFLAVYSNGGSLKESVKFGSANATATIQEVGADSGILYGDEDLHMMPIQKI